MVRRIPKKVVFSMWKTYLLVKYYILILSALLYFEVINAQNDSCKVLLKKISGEYKGECENGVANGKGKSTGEDTYTGTFVNGVPDGKGKYLFKNGDVYQGYWKDGKKDGKGEFTFSINGVKQVLVDYWKNDEYIGVTLPDMTYRVGFVSGISNYKIENIKSGGENENENKIIFSIKSAFTDFAPQDLKIQKSSGDVLQYGKKIGVINYSYPLHCEISYSIVVAYNRKQCRFIIDILKEGEYSITLFND